MGLNLQFFAFLGGGRYNRKNNPRGVGREWGEGGRGGQPKFEFLGGVCVASEELPTYIKNLL